MKKIEKQEKLDTSNIATVVKGTFIAWAITLISLFIYSCVLAYTNISDSTIPVVTIILTVISILIGSSLATHRIKNNGLLNGALVGGIYLLTIYLISSFLGDFGFTLSMYAIIMLISGMVAGAVRTE